MDLSEIQALIKFVSKSGVSEVELETKDFKINIKTGSREPHKEMQQVVAMPATSFVPAAPVQPVAQPSAAPAPASAEAPARPQAPANDDSKYITIKSPMIGTFYRSPNPESPVFVNVGDDLTKGKVICIIEAMKLFNEIESEVSGKVVKVLVDDATPVEYDQPLFLVDPS